MHEDSSLIRSCNTRQPLKNETLYYPLDMYKFILNPRGGSGGASSASFLNSSDQEFLRLTADPSSDITCLAVRGDNGFDNDL